MTDKISRLPSDDRDALVLISQIIDHYQGGFSFQGLYAMREVLSAREIEGDIEVVLGFVESPITIGGVRPKLPGRCRECRGFVGKHVGVCSLDAPAPAAPPAQEEGRA